MDTIVRQGHHRSRTMPTKVKSTAKRRRVRKAFLKAAICFVLCIWALGLDVAFAENEEASARPSDSPSMEPTLLMWTVKPKQNTPTLAPSLGAPLGVPCNVCGSEFYDVGAPDALIRDPIKGDDNVTCAELQARGDAQWYTPVQCSIIQLAVFNPCKCILMAPPTGAPVAPTVAPEPTTAAPSQPTTNAPSTAPVPLPTSSPMAPTNKPSSAPTLSLRSLTGNINVVFDSVESLMPPLVQADQAKQTTAFFNDLLVNVTPPLRNLQTTWLRQEFGSGPARRRLQTDSLKELVTYLTVTADHQPSIFLDDNIFSQLLAKTINENNATYMSYLRNNGTSPTTSAYFQPVVSVSSSQSAATTSFPTMAPTPEITKKGLETGAIVGIAVGAFLGIVVMVGAIYHIKKRKQANRNMAAVPSASTDGGPGDEYGQQSALGTTTAVRGDKRGSNTSSQMAQDNELTPSLADNSMPAASDLESQSGFETNSQMGGTSVGGADDVSYAYSLDAGNVTTTSTAGFAAGAGASVDDSAASKRYARTVVAPAGKLGIVIDTTLEGPVVHRVNPGSPLEGVLFPGDIIVAIDDVDTRAMSASSITALMIKTANKKRNLTVQSYDPNR